MRWAIRRWFAPPKDTRAAASTLLHLRLRRPPGGQVARFHSQGEDGPVPDRNARAAAVAMKRLDAAQDAEDAGPPAREGDPADDDDGDGLEPRGEGGNVSAGKRPLAVLVSPFQDGAYSPREPQQWQR